MQTLSSLYKLAIVPGDDQCGTLRMVLAVPDAPDYLVYVVLHSRSTGAVATARWAGHVRMAALPHQHGHTTTGETTRALWYYVARQSTASCRVTAAVHSPDV